jgi:hypothetical protein
VTHQIRHQTFDDVKVESDDFHIGRLDDRQAITKSFSRSPNGRRTLSSCVAYSDRITPGGASLNPGLISVQPYRAADLHAGTRDTELTPNELAADLHAGRRGRRLARCERAAPLRVQKSHLRTHAGRRARTIIVVHIHARRRSISARSAAVSFHDAARLFV